MDRSSSAGPAVNMRDEKDGPGISTLLKRLGTETGELVRAEVALAKLEFTDLARQAALDGAKVGAAAALALVGALALAAAAVLALADVLGGRYTLAALVIGLVLLVTGALLARSGVRSMGRPGHRETMASLRHDKEWAAGELRDLRQQLRKGQGQAERPALKKPEVGRGA